MGASDPTFRPYRAVRGLGNAGDWDTGSGVFRRPRYDGGGLFNAVSGLGAVPADLGKFLGAGVIGFALVAILMKR
jgi:hypothetical protein